MLRFSDPRNALACAALLVVLSWSVHPAGARAQDEATPASDEATSPSEATSSEASIDEAVLSQPTRRGHVVGLERFIALVQLDSGELPHVDEHIAIVVPAEPLCPNRISSDDMDCIVVGRVRELRGRTVVVQLGVGERVPVGARAEPTDETVTGHRLAPPRVGGYFESYAAIGTGATFNVFGLSGFAEGFVGYRGNRPVFVRLEMGPTGFLVVRGPNEHFGSFVAIIGLDSRLFAFGMGLGVARHDTRRQSIPEIAPAASTPVVMRFGAYDGLHLDVRLDFMTRREFTEFAGGEFLLQTPTRRGSWITARWGYSRGGILRVEVGFRRLVIGDMGAGSHFIHVEGGVLGFNLRETPSRDALLLNVATGVGGTIGWESRFR